MLTILDCKYRYKQILNLHIQVDFFVEPSLRSEMSVKRLKDVKMDMMEAYYDTFTMDQFATFLDSCFSSRPGRSKKLLVFHFFVTFLLEKWIRFAFRCYGCFWNCFVYSQIAMAPET